MPLYTFTDTTTGRVWDDIMTLSERETFLKENPHVEQSICAPPLVDPTRLSIKGVNNKADSSFRDLLKDMKTKFRGSTINAD